METQRERERERQRHSLEFNIMGISDITGGPLQGVGISSERSRGCPAVRTPERGKGLAFNGVNTVAARRACLVARRIEGAEEKSG